MTWIPDMEPDPIGTDYHSLAIGWLHPDHPYPRGRVSVEFMARLRELVLFAQERILSWGALGYHTCEFCEQADGMLNFGVPSGNVLFIAPEMIVHYVEVHEYAPPDAFVAAVMASPPPGTPAVLDAAECSRRFVMEHKPWKDPILLDRLMQDMREAMKARNALSVSVLRMTVAAVKNFRIESGEDVSEEDVIGVLKKAIGLREEAIESYRQAGRADLAEREEREAWILSRYLP